MSVTVPTLTSGSLQIVPSSNEKEKEEINRRTGWWGQGRTQFTHCPGAGHPSCPPASSWLLSLLTDLSSGSISASLLGHQYYLCPGWEALPSSTPCSAPPAFFPVPVFILAGQQGDATCPCWLQLEISAAHEPCRCFVPARLICLSLA